jgi:multidrug efflux pump subunit AcrA (membrane-fusion protein)
LPTFSAFFSRKRVVVKKSTKVLIGIAIAVVVALVGVVTARALAPQPDPTAVLITDSAAVMDITSTVAASGEVKATEQMGVKFAVAGDVASVAVEAGDVVNEGDTLATLDTVALEAAVAAAQSTLSSARDGVSAANLAEAQAQQAINTADQALATAEKALADAKDLSSNRSEGVSAARAQIGAAEAQRDTAEYQQARVPAQKAAASAGLASAQAGLESAQANLTKATLTSPMSGTVLSVAVEDGDSVTSAGADLFVIADLRGFEVVANFSESDIVGIEEGQEVEVDFDALPEDSTTGTVTEVGLVGQVDPSGGTLTTYEVTVTVDNPPAKLRVGMTAQVNIITDETPSVVAVPAAALNVEGDQTVVNVIESDGTIRAVYVETGVEGSGFVEITNGLEGGETVVIGDVGEFPVVGGEWEPGTGPPPGVEDQQRQQEQFN